MTSKELIINVQGFLQEAVEKYGREADDLTDEINSIIAHIDYHLAD